MAGTLLFLLLLVLLLFFLLAIVLLPVMAIGYYFWKWQLPRARRRALVEPSEPLLRRLENSNC
jgi:uncharacterized protein HemY